MYFSKWQLLCTLTFRSFTSEVLRTLWKAAVPVSSTCFQRTVPFLVLISNLLSLVGEKVVEPRVCFHTRIGHVPTCAARTTLRPAHTGMLQFIMPPKVSPPPSRPQIPDDLTCIWEKPSHLHVKCWASEKFSGIWIIKHIFFSPCKVNYLDSFCK